MVSKMPFAAQQGKPQFENDLRVVETLQGIMPGAVDDEHIKKLAMLLIRYDYPVDLAAIAEGWGFSLNSLLASARNAWERGEYVSVDTEMSGSGWDAAQDS